MVAGRAFAVERDACLRRWAFALEALFLRFAHGSNERRGCQLNSPGER